MNIHDYLVTHGPLSEDEFEKYIPKNFQLLGDVVDMMLFFYVRVKTRKRYEWLVKYASDIPRVYEMIKKNDELVDDDSEDYNFTFTPEEDVIQIMIEIYCNHPDEAKYKWLLGKFSIPINNRELYLSLEHILCSGDLGQCNDVRIVYRYMIDENKVASRSDWLQCRTNIVPRDSIGETFVQICLRKGICMYYANPTIQMKRFLEKHRDGVTFNNLLEFITTTSVKEFRSLYDSCQVVRDDVRTPSPLLEEVRLGDPVQKRRLFYDYSSEHEQSTEKPGRPFQNNNAGYLLCSSHLISRQQFLDEEAEIL